MALSNIAGRYIDERRLYRNEVGSHQAMNRIFEHRAEIGFIGDIEIFHTRHHRMAFVLNCDVLFRATAKTGGRIIFAANILQGRSPIGGRAHDFDISVRTIDAGRPGVGPRSDGMMKEHKTLVAVLEELLCVGLQLGARNRIHKIAK